jgi:hypothetical protein
MRSIYFILACLLLTGCLKADIAPTPAKSNTSIVQNVSTNKTDTVKSVSYSPDTDASNPDYWYNGTKGSALIQVTCKDCDAIATIGTITIPFIFNSAGVGTLKYTPSPELLIRIAVCPGSAKAIKADVLDSSNKALYSYSGVITGNWIGTYSIK